MGTGNEVIKRRTVNPGGPKHVEILRDRGPGIRVVTGGYGSLKTTLGCAFVVDVGLRYAHLGAPILGCEPTYPMVRDVMEQSMMANLDRWGIPYRHWAQAHIFEIGRKRKFEFWCRSLDRPRSTEGINAMACWIDEWELCAADAIIPAMARVRVIDQGQKPAEVPMEKFLTGTAEGYGKPYNLILAKPSPTTRAYILTTEDNPFAPDSYIAETKAMLGTDEAVAEKIYGIRTAKGGRVYSRFNRRTHCKDPVVKTGRGQIQIAVDFNVRYMHWLVLEVDREAGCAHVVGEVIKEGGSTTDEHAERTANWIAQYLTRTRRRLYTREDVYKMKVPAYCDASGGKMTSNSNMSDVHLLLQAGFSAQHGASNPSVANRVNTLNVLFRDHRISIDAEACPILVQNLETQARDKNGEPDKKDNIDHAIDGLGYLAHWQWPVHTRPEPAPAMDALADEWGPVG